LVAGTRSGFVLLLGNGNGTFQSPIANTTTSSAESIATADLNGDGKPDLIITSTSHANSALVLYGNGNGTFQRFKKVNLPNDYLIAIGDVNGDGKLDLVSNTGYVSYGESGVTFTRRCTSRMDTLPTITNRPTSFFLTCGMQDTWTSPRRTFTGRFPCC
jgi:hypothetical protein